MDASRAGQLILVMQGTWPRFCEDDAAATLWLNDLEALDYALGQRAVRYLRDSDEFAPSWARFRHVYDDRAKIGAGSEMPRELGSMPARHSASLEAIAQARAMLPPRPPKPAVREPEPAMEFTGTVDPLVPPLTYDEVYESSGAPKPGYEADVMRWRNASVT